MTETHAAVRALENPGQTLQEIAGSLERRSTNAKTRTALEKLIAAKITLAQEYLGPQASNAQIFVGESPKTLSQYAAMIAGIVAATGEALAPLGAASDDLLRVGCSHSGHHALVTGRGTIYQLAELFDTCVYIAHTVQRIARQLCTVDQLGYDGKLAVDLTKPTRGSAVPGYCSVCSRSSDLVRDGDVASNIRMALTWGADVRGPKFTICDACLFEFEAGIIEQRDSRRLGFMWNRSNLVEQLREYIASHNGNASRRATRSRKPRPRKRAAASKGKRRRGT